MVKNGCHKKCTVTKSLYELNHVKRRRLSEEMQRKDQGNKGGSKNCTWGRGNSLRYLNFKEMIWLIRTKRLPPTSL